MLEQNFPFYIVSCFTRKKFINFSTNLLYNVRGSGSGSGSTSQKVIVHTVPVPFPVPVLVPVPQHCNLEHCVIWHKYSISVHITVIRRLNFLSLLFCLMVGTRKIISNPISALLNTTVSVYEVFECLLHSLVRKE